jgi:hypothetical protein
LMIRGIRASPPTSRDVSQTVLATFQRKAVSLQSSITALSYHNSKVLLDIRFCRHDATLAGSISFGKGL